MSSTKHLTLKLGETSETLRQSQSFKRFNGFCVIKVKSMVDFKSRGEVLLYEGKTQWEKNEITDYNKSMEKANILIPLTKKGKSKVVGVFSPFNGSSWRDKLGKYHLVSASRLSQDTIPDVAHTPQSVSFSAWTPPCRPCTSPEAYSFLFPLCLSLSFSFLPWRPINESEIYRTVV